MRSSLIVAAVIGSGALALTGSLPATAMPVAKLAEVAQAQANVDQVGWCRRHWHNTTSWSWYLAHRYAFSGTLLYFGPHYKYADKKAGW